MRPQQSIAQRYLVQSVLGIGGMGEVYRAHDQRLDRAVALKILPEFVQQRDARSVERFLQQARLAARVNHPAVVQVFDCDVDAGVPFVVQELLDGVTVAEALAQGALPPQAALELIRELIQALIVVHGAGIIHRDIKPSNLFLQNVGAQRPQLKVLDFGLSRLVSTSQSLTRTGETFGTLSYMPPEQLTNAKGVRLTADVYAVGAVLFELLTGQPPFVRASRAALKLAIILDPVPDAEALAPHLERGLGAVLRRALAKRAEERYASLTELAAALAGYCRGPSAGSRVSETRDVDHGQGRYRFLRRLGSGAHGEVFAALDTRSGCQVAIKRTKSLDLESCFRLRNEFRVLSRLRHPNVVRAYELLGDASGPELMMELVEGEPFDRYTRGSLRRLFAVAVQLADGLRALHSAGLSHQDLKPNNVLVDASGRAVLVDFGIAAGLSADGRAAAGKYMAPEARLGLRNAKADLYALGVMLGDALGELPADRGSDHSAHAQLRMLRELTTRLTARSPAERPDAVELHELLSRLHERSPAASAVPNSALLFGRAAELAALHAGFKTVLLQRAAVVDIHGGPGSGKTALLDAFCAGLPASVVCLRRKAVRGESLRFRVFDPLIEALLDRLTTLPAETLHKLVPAEIDSLASVFPVLTRLSSVHARTASEGRATPDQSDVRASAIEVLRELLVGFARLHPLVVVLDDLHEADAGELAWLSQLLRAPGCPVALWLFARAAQPVSAPMEALMQHVGGVPVELGALDAEQVAEHLAQRLPATPAVAASILAEAEGHPHLLRTMIEGANGWPDTQPFSLTALIARRLDALTAPKRRLVELASVGDHALGTQVLYAAAKAGPHELSDLEAEGWLRRGWGPTADSVESYHPRLKLAVRAALAPADKQRMHTELARLLEQLATPGAARIEHLIGSGQAQSAVQLCHQLGHDAEGRGAFAEAAELYEAALAQLPAGAASVVALLERLAEALHCQGRSRDAARALLRLVEQRSVLHLERAEQRASELLMLSGDLAHGLALLEQSLARHDLKLPVDLSSTLQETVHAYLALQQRGLGFDAKTREQCDQSALARGELLLATAVSLGHMDLRGLPFVFRAAHAALDLGIESLIIKACALLVWNTVSHFPNELVEPALALCRRLITASAGPYEEALLHVALSEYHHSHGSFLAAEAECERAEHLLVSGCRAVAREIAGVRNMQAFLQYAYKGDFRSRVDETVRWMAEAEACGNAYQLNMLRSAHALVWVARDRPEQARAQLAAAEREWPRGLSVFEATVTLFLDVIDRYEGDLEAHLRPAQGRSAILLSPMAQTPLFKGYIELQRVWGAIAVLGAGKHHGDEADAAKRSLTSLRQLHLPVWDAVADAFEANLILLSGDSREAVALLEHSERTLRGLHMLCLAACARRRRGEATGGVVGERVLREAESELRDLGVVRVDKWCRAYFSPFELRARELLTLHSLA